MILISALAAAVLLQAGHGAGAPSGNPDVPLLVVLSATGQQRDGLPVVVAHPQPQPYTAVLLRGYSGRLLRLYLLAQRFARPDRAAQPAYLLLSDNQGGFPRTGFHLDGARPDVSYVDLHRNSTISGRPGAMDQIFPHELLHVIVQDLVGEPPEGHASQVHAIGVRTDRSTAFGEGFAEHGQLMAIEAADAVADTRALATDTAAVRRAQAQMDAYRRAVSARWAIAPQARMTFPFWFSRTEQVMRYSAVRDNLFAYEPDVPDRLFTERRAYDAYLLENVLPGRGGAPPKSAARMLATEGVVSALFYRLVTAPAVRNGMREEAFYNRFRATRAQVDPFDNAYLKVFAAIREGGYDAAGVVRAYGRLFPEEREVSERIFRDTLLGQAVPQAKELWLLNERATTGTSLFDQYRGLPRAHAFDLNASSRADLAGVPGMQPHVATAIRAALPLDSIDDLQRVPGVTADLIRTFREMRRAMEAPPAPGTSQEGTLSIRNILMPYARRALVVWMIAAALAAVLYRSVRSRAWWRVVLNGLAAALAGLLAGWTIDNGTGLLALAAPIILFGGPGAVIGMWRSHSLREGGIVLAAWSIAAVPAALAVRPIG